MREPLKKLLYKWINNRYDRNEATDEVISLIHGEIEKELLTTGERETIWETGENQDPFVDFERVAQAQLNKILSLLGGKDGS